MLREYCLLCFLIENFNVMCYFVLCNVLICIKSHRTDIIILYIAYYYCSPTIKDANIRYYDSAINYVLFKEHELLKLAKR